MCLYSICDSFILLDFLCWQVHRRTNLLSLHKVKQKMTLGAEEGTFTVHEVHKLDIVASSFTIPLLSI